MTDQPLIAYGTSQVAEWTGVTRAAVSNWLVRRDDFPIPDVVIISAGGGEEWGWTAERRPEWEAFADARRGANPATPKRKRRYWEGGQP